MLLFVVLLFVAGYAVPPDKIAKYRLPQLLRLRPKLYPICMQLQSKEMNDGEDAGHDEEFSDSDEADSDDDTSMVRDEKDDHEEPNNTLQHKISLTNIVLKADTGMYIGMYVGMFVGMWVCGYWH